MIRPRWPLAALALLGAFCSATLIYKSVARADTLDLYVGGYTRKPGDGLALMRFDTVTGTLSGQRLAAPISNPDWLTLSANGRTLYAGGARDGQSGLTAFAVEKNGDLREIASQVGEQSPVSLAIDASGKWLIGAYYNSGNWAIWPIEADGVMGARAATIQHKGSGPDKSRQQSPHAHQALIAPDNKRIWICDLGTDKAMIYDFDARTGAVKPSVPPFAEVHAGSGPRHLAWGKNGDVAYVVNELSSTVSVFQGARGVPGNIQTISTLPTDFAGRSSGAEILVAPGGRFVYASNRGFDSLARFAVQRDGSLKSLGFTKVGKEPRHFTFDPTGRWMLVGNQQSRSIEVFAFDKKSGDLTLKSKFEGVLNEPTCLVFRR